MTAEGRREMERLIKIAEADEGEGGMSAKEKQDGLNKLISSAKRLILKLKREQFDSETSTGIDNW